MNEVANYNGSNPFRIFDYKNLGSVRTAILENGELGFCAMDVCRILGIANSRRAVDRLAPKGVHIVNTLTNGGPQGIVFVEEIELYKLIFTSRKTEAKEFSEWVAGVIKTIRKTGSYNMIEDESIPIQIRYMNQVNKVINLACNKIEKLEKQYKFLDESHKELKEEEYNHYNDLTGKYDELDNRTVYILDRQDYIIEEAYHTVMGFARYMGVDVNTINTNHLGKVASKLCRENGIPTGTYPDGRYMVNTYPYKILLQVFNENVFIYQNSN